MEIKGTGIGDWWGAGFSRARVPRPWRGGAVGGGGQHAPVALVAPRITLDTGDKPSGKALVGFQRQAKPSPKALRKGGRSRPGLLGSSLYCFAVAQSLSVCSSL